MQVKYLCLNPYNYLGQFGLVTPNDPTCLYQRVEMHVNSVIFRIVMPKTDCFKKLKQTTFYSHQITKYLKFALI